MRRTIAVFTTLAAVAAVTSGPLVAPASAIPQGYECPAHTGEFARTGASVLWPGKVKGKNVLYGCTAFYGEKPRSFRLGPWNKASKASFDGQTVVWTARKPGTKEDAVWVADASVGSTWLRGVRPTTGKGSSADVKVERLVAAGEVAAWVTTRGTLVMAVSSPQDDAQAIGASSPAATQTPATSPTTGAPQGLLSPLVAKGKRIVIGRWEALASPAFADSLEVLVGDGEGDECGGVNPYDVTVEPLAGGARVGAEISAYWGSSSEVCG